MSVRSKLKYEKEQLRATNNMLNFLRENTKINENKFFFESFHGKSMIGDPYAIFKYMASQEEYSDATFVWALNNTEDVTDKKYLEDKRVKFIKMRSKDYLYHQATAKVIFNNTSLPASFVKRDEQIYVNTWHGTPFKTLGKDMKGPRATHANLTANFLKADFMLHACEFTRDKIEQSHDIDDVWTGEAIMSAPRFELCKKNEIIENYLVETFNWNKEEETILYAPTWKGNLKGIDSDFTNMINDFKMMKAKFPEKNILMKVHSLIFSRMNDEEKKYVINDRYDMNEIMYYVDTLITDYSSSFFDFAALNKKIIHYMPDFDYYDETRGMYLSVSELPGLIAYTQKELEEAISNNPVLDYTEFNGKYNNSMNLMSIEDLLVKIYTKPVPRLSGKENVIVYAGGFESNGITKSFVNLTKKWDFEKYNLIVIDKNKWREDQEATLQQLDPRVKFIYRCGRLVMGRNERVKYHEFIKNPKKQENLDAVKSIMQREHKRTIGNSKIDYALDFSGYMYFWSLYLLNLECKKRYIFQHSNMFLEEKKIVDGEFIHREKLNIEFNIYSHFDKIIAVSKETMLENHKNLSRYYSLEQTEFVENFIDEEEIYTKKEILSNELTNVYYSMEQAKQKIKEEIKAKAKITSKLARKYQNTEEKTEIINNDFITVGYFGRVGPEKGQVEFVQKLPELLKYYPKMIVVICGTGTEVEKIKEIINQDGTQNHVIMPGYIKNPYALMKILDYTALFSFTEGQPMVLLESLLVGTKVVASDIPGCVSVLQGKYGLCVENNIEGIVSAFNDDTNYEEFDVVEYNKNISAKFDALLK